MLACISICFMDMTLVFVCLLYCDNCNAYLATKFALNVLLQDLDISQKLVLSSVDEVNLLSLSECRVADQILDLVPNIEAGSCFPLHSSPLFLLQRWHHNDIHALDCRTSEQL